MVPAGEGYSLKQLKQISDAELNNTFDLGLRPFSLLLSGPSGCGKRTHGKAFARSLGIECIKETSATLLYADNHVMDFFYPTGMETAYLISDIDYMRSDVTRHFYNIVTSGEYEISNHIRHTHESYYVNGYIILTADRVERVSDCILENLNYHVPLQKWNKECKLYSIFVTAHDN